MKLTGIEEAWADSFFDPEGVIVLLPPPADPYIHRDQRIDTYFKASNYRPRRTTYGSANWAGYLLTLTVFQDVGAVLCSCLQQTFQQIAKISTLIAGTPMWR